MAKQLQVFIGLAFLSIFFIVWNALNYFLFLYSLSIITFLTWIVVLIVYQYLQNKSLNQGASLGISLLLGFFCISAADKFLIYRIFSDTLSLIAAIITYRFVEGKNFSYEQLRLYSKIGLALLIPIGGLLPYTSLELTLDTLKYFLLYLVFGIITLRLIRQHVYAVEEKKLWRDNIVISAGILILSINTVIAFILAVIFKTYNGIAYILEKILYVIFLPVAYLLRNVRNDNMPQMEHAISQVLSNISDLLDGYKSTADSIPVRDAAVSVNTVIAMAKVFSILVLFFIILQFFRKAGKRKQLIKQDTTEHRETIVIKRKTPIERIISFFQKSSFRDIILSTYQGFEQKADNRGIFETHFTASELKNETAPLIENKNELDTLSTIYNEAKFSNHILTEEDVRKAKESYSGLKKDL